MYDLIYQFLLGNLFNGDFSDCTFEIGGVTMNGNEWLAHTCTIVSVVLMFVFSIAMLKWVFKLVGGLFVGIGK